MQIHLVVKGGWEVKKKKHRVRLLSFLRVSHQVAQRAKNNSECLFKELQASTRHDAAPFVNTKKKQSIQLGFVH